jgi:hypothetical protein
MFVYWPGFRWKEQPVHARATLIRTFRVATGRMHDIDITFHTTPVYNNRFRGRLIAHITFVAFFSGTSCGSPTLQLPC